MSRLPGVVALFMVSVERSLLEKKMDMQVHERKGKHHGDEQRSIRWIVILLAMHFIKKSDTTKLHSLVDSDGPRNKTPSARSFTVVANI